MPKKAKDDVNDQESPSSEGESLQPTEIKSEEKQENYRELLDQIKSEFNVGLKHVRQRWSENTSRLKLYNNQKRNKEHIGDPLLFSTFQTSFASLYDDEMQHEFEGREEGDMDTAENLNNLASFDYKIMQMPDVVREWMWNTCFVSRALVDLSEFDRESTKTTKPFVVDPFSLIRDPKGTSVNGINGRGALRYLGYLISMTQFDIDQLADFKNQNAISKAETSQEIWEIKTNRELRDSAAGNDVGLRKNQITGENKEYDFFVWYTRCEGKRVRVLVSTDFNTLHRYFELPNQDQWCIADMALNPTPGSWDGVSIPDLVEDKQRHRAAVLNASLKLVKFSQMPSYIFDSNKVDATNIAKTEFGNIIPSNGDANTAVALMQKDQVKSDVSWILDQIDSMAQRSTATPDMQQGVVSKQQRTLGELNMVSNKVDSRYSLTARIFSGAFERFWNIWYLNYKEYFAKEIDKKVIRISGVNGPIWKSLTRENIISTNDPDVKVESKQIIESRKQNTVNISLSFHTLASKDPSYNIRGGLKQLARLIGKPSDEINTLFRKSADEIEAEEENLVLAKNKLKDENSEALLKLTQDHDAHIETHAKAVDNEAKIAHIAAHNHAKLILRDNAMAKMQVEATKNPMGSPMGGQVGAPMGGTDNEIASANMNKQSVTDNTPNLPVTA